ncbi:hypothetical protein PSM7751_00601 [Pseudooceanicola marinus]|uniref:Uncharacterized protein n=1 Tax=Pseudooceanicola marinus TaxID=396013 RepID=A0A1X6YDU5_9RHOB|nr:hypothetical protein [Pseudooceanicola marinus]SLN18260.1 hypothetical protein PSM7751_00601 [Pseudooceanicola marinus]
MVGKPCRIPWVSCNVALVWVAVQQKAWNEVSEAGLAVWISGTLWQERLERMFPAP